MFPDRALLEHGEYLLERSRHFGLSRKDHARRGKCAKLHSHLAVMVINTVQLRNLSAPLTCHRVRMLLIFAFDAANFSLRSPDFHTSLGPGSFFLPRFGLISLSQFSRSPRTLRHRQTHTQAGSKTTRTLQAPSGQCLVYVGLVVPFYRCRMSRGG